MPLSHLTDHSAAASRSRVDIIRDGLDGPALNRPIWIEVAKRRIAELECHGAAFGFEDFEREELAALEDLLGIGVQQRARG